MIDYVERITGKTSKLGTKAEKGRKAEQETRGDAEESTETQRFSQHRVPRWKDRAKPAGQRRVSSREVGGEPRLSTMKQN